MFFEVFGRFFPLKLFFLHSYFKLTALHSPTSHFPKMVIIIVLEEGGPPIAASVRVSDDEEGGHTGTVHFRIVSGFLD